LINYLNLKQCQRYPHLKGIGRCHFPGDTGYFKTMLTKILTAIAEPIMRALASIFIDWVKDLRAEAYKSQMLEDVKAASDLAKSPDKEKRLEGNEKSENLINSF